jgi:hypothetical protein
VAIVFGFSPKFGAVVAATPGAVLGGITVVLYGMIGLLGAKIWVENRVDFANPINLVPLAAGIIIGIGNVNLQVTDDFALQGIALGTLVTILMYHVVKAVAPEHMKAELRRGRGYEGGTGPALGHAGAHDEASLGERGYEVDAGDVRPGHRAGNDLRKDR